jgi:hypothetical protein
MKHIAKYTRKNGTVVKSHDRGTKSTGTRPKYQKPALRQVGSSNTEHDKWNKAEHPGKRLSEDGKIYYEYRRNRSDKDKRARL